MAGSDCLFTVELALDFYLECPVLLNSQKLTISVVKAIAQVLSIPNTEMKEETVLMIEGKLVEDGREPQNIQVGVVACETMPGTFDLKLISENGPFLIV